MKYKLKELAQIQYGKDHKKLKDGNIPVFGTGGLMRYGDNYLFEGDSVLIPRKGSLNNLQFVTGKFWTVDTLFWTKIDVEKVIPKYLFYVLKRFDFAQMNVGSAVPSLTTALLNELEVEIPDINLQQSILDKINPFESQITNLSEINDNLTELITVMFNQSKDAWPTAALGSLLHPESKSIKKKEQKKARFLNTGDVTNGVFENVDLSDTDSMPGQAKKLINRDDILYSEIRPVNRHFGLVRLDKPEEYVVSTKLMVLRRNEDVQLPVEYLYFLLTSAAMIREMQFEAESRSGTFPQITFDVIKGYQVPVPPTNHPILGLIKTAINNKIDNDTESALLAETRDTLLNELLH